MKGFQSSPRDYLGNVLVDIENDLNRQQEMERAEAAKYAKVREADTMQVPGDAIASEWDRSADWNILNTINTEIATQMITPSGPTGRLIKKMGEAMDIDPRQLFKDSTGHVWKDEGMLRSLVKAGYMTDRERQATVRRQSTFIENLDRNWSEMMDAFAYIVPAAWDSLAATSHDLVTGDKEGLKAGAKKAYNVAGIMGDEIVASLGAMIQRPGHYLREQPIDFASWIPLGMAKVPGALKAAAKAKKGERLATAKYVYKHTKTGDVIRGGIGKTVSMIPVPNAVKRAFFDLYAGTPEPFQKLRRAFQKGRDADTAIIEDTVLRPMSEAMKGIDDANEAAQLFDALINTLPTEALRKKAVGKVKDIARIKSQKPKLDDVKTPDGDTDYLDEDFIREEILKDPDAIIWFSNKKDPKYNAVQVAKAKGQVVIMVNKPKMRELWEKFKEDPQGYARPIPEEYQDIRVVTEERPPPDFGPDTVPEEPPDFKAMMDEMDRDLKERSSSLEEPEHIKEWDDRFKDQYGEEPPFPPGNYDEYGNLVEVVEETAKKPKYQTSLNPEDPKHWSQNPDGLENFRDLLIKDSFEGVGDYIDWDVVANWFGKNDDITLTAKDWGFKDNKGKPMRVSFDFDRDFPGARLSIQLNPKAIEREWKAYKAGEAATETYRDLKDTLQVFKKLGFTIDMTADSPRTLSIRSASGTLDARGEITGFVSYGQKHVALNKAKLKKMWEDPRFKDGVFGAIPGVEITPLNIFKDFDEFLNHVASHELAHIELTRGDFFNSPEYLRYRPPVERNAKTPWIKRRRPSKLNSDNEIKRFQKDYETVVTEMTKKKAEGVPHNERLVVIRRNGKPVEVDALGSAEAWEAMTSRKLQKQFREDNSKSQLAFSNLWKSGMWGAYETAVDRIALSRQGNPYKIGGRANEIWPKPRSSDVFGPLEDKPFKGKKYRNVYDFINAKMRDAARSARSQAKHEYTRVRTSKEAKIPKKEIDAETARIEEEWRPEYGDKQKWITNELRQWSAGKRRALEDSGLEQKKASSSIEEARLDALDHLEHDLAIARRSEHLPNFRNHKLNLETAQGPREFILHGLKDQSTKFLAKDQGKADLANAFIGVAPQRATVTKRGTDKGKARRTSTASYAVNARRQGIPTNEDITNMPPGSRGDMVAFVSVPGRSRYGDKAVGRWMDDQKLAYQHARNVLADDGILIMDNDARALSKHNIEGEGTFQKKLLKEPVNKERVFKREIEYKGEKYNIFSRNKEKLDNFKPPEVPKGKRVDELIGFGSSRFLNLPRGPRGDLKISKGKGRDSSPAGFEWHERYKFSDKEVARAVREEIKFKDSKSFTRRVKEETPLEAGRRNRLSTEGNLLNWETNKVFALAMSLAGDNKARQAEVKSIMNQPQGYWKGDKATEGGKKGALVDFIQKVRAGEAKISPRTTEDLKKMKQDTRDMYDKAGDPISSKTDQSVKMKVRENKRAVEQPELDFSPPVEDPTTLIGMPEGYWNSNTAYMKYRKLKAKEIDKKKLTKEEKQFLSDYDKNNAEWKKEFDKPVDTPEKDPAWVPVGDLKDLMKVSVVDKKGKVVRSKTVEATPEGKAKLDMQDPDLFDGLPEGAEYKLRIEDLFDEEIFAGAGAPRYLNIYDLFADELKSGATNPKAQRFLNSPEDKATRLRYDEAATNYLGSDPVDIGARKRQKIFDKKDKEYKERLDKAEKELSGMKDEIDAAAPKWVTWTYDGIPMNTSQFIFDFQPGPGFDVAKVGVDVADNAPNIVKKHIDRLLNVKRAMFELGKRQTNIRVNRDPRVAKAGGSNTFLSEDFFKAQVASYLPLVKAMRKWEVGSADGRALQKWFDLADQVEKQKNTGLAGVVSTAADKGDLSKLKEAGYAVGEHFVDGLELALPKLIDDINRYKFYDDLSKMEGLTSETPKPGWVKLEGKTQVKRGLEQGGNVERYGALEGLFVPEDVAAVIRSGERHIRDVETAWTKFVQQHKRFISVLKHNKLMANFSTQVHNILGIAQLMVGENVGVHRLGTEVKNFKKGFNDPFYEALAKTGYLPKAARGVGDVSDTLEAITKAKGPGDFFKVMMDDYKGQLPHRGKLEALLSTAARGSPELAMQAIEHVSYQWLGAGGRLAKLFTATDRLGRYVLFKSEIEKLAKTAKITPEQALKNPSFVKQAAQFSSDIMLDYTDLPTAINWMRSSGVEPFIAYPWRAAEYFIKYPFRKGKTYKTLQAFRQGIQGSDTPEQRLRRRSAFPNDIMYPMGEAARSEMSAIAGAFGLPEYKELNVSPRYWTPVPSLPDEPLGLNRPLYDASGLTGESGLSPLDERSALSKLTGVPLPDPMAAGPFLAAAQGKIWEDKDSALKQMLPPYVAKTTRDTFYGKPISKRDLASQAFLGVRTIPQEHRRHAYDTGEKVIKKLKGTARYKEASARERMEEEASALRRATRTTLF